MIISELDTRLGFNGLSVMYHIARVLAASIDLRRTMDDVLEILDIHAGMKRGMISILDAQKTELSVDVARGISDQDRLKGRYRVGEGITGRVVDEGRSILIPRIKEEPAFLNKTGARNRLSIKDNTAFLCVPIKVGDETIGALSVDRICDTLEILKDEMRYLEAIADLIAQIVNQRRASNERIDHLEKENLALRKTLEDMGRPDEMIGNAGVMKDVFRQIGQVSGLSTTVLVFGQTGTGKELVARAIHDRSACKNGPFVAVNCGALPESLLESTLFGHEKGAFTGAHQAQMGQFEAADNGTLFLDEIGELSLSAQARLLRAIQEREFVRVGGTRPIKVNVRLVCATNRDLSSMVAEGTFREDLYYRINVFTLLLPPLKDRGADVLLLADYFTKKYAKIHGKPITRISTPAIDCLSAYHWPGNVRELENVIERAVIVASGDAINAHDMPPTLQIKSSENASPAMGVTFEKMVAAYEVELLTDALKDVGGNQTEAAELLGTTKRVVQYKVQQYGIDYKRFKT